MPAKRTRLMPALLLALLIPACEAAGPASPEVPDPAMQLVADQNRAFATLRRASARYHDVNTAIADGFILLHECEVRPGEGAVGVLYVHLGRYLDGSLDARSPDGLLYEPARNGGLELAGVELALPEAMWTSPGLPQFLGVPFQVEEEFGALGLHIWVWKHNPDGMFAQAHPGIACGAEA